MTNGLVIEGVATGRVKDRYNFKIKFEPSETYPLRGDIKFDKPFMSSPSLVESYVPTKVSVEKITNGIYPKIFIKGRNLKNDTIKSFKMDISIIDGKLTGNWNGFGIKGHLIEMAPNDWSVNQCF